MTRSIMWVKPKGAEIADVELAAGRLAARGTAIGGDPLPYRLEYELTTGERYVTARLLVEAHGTDESGPWRRSLELINRPEGEWSVSAQAEGGAALPLPGGDAALLRGALDCDLGLSPLTNTMPALRLPGEGDEPVEFLMAWVSVPDLAVTPSWQTYQVVRRDGALTVVRFTTPGFTEEIVFEDGLVLDYPSIGRRVVPEAGPPAPPRP